MDNFNGSFWKLSKGIALVLGLFVISICAQGQAFITTWKTDNPGPSNDDQITIPTAGTGYNYAIDWGDGNTDISVTGNITHTYTAAGTYTVSISGTFPRIYFNGGGDRQKILTVEAWGNIAWSSMAGAFRGCSNLAIPAADAPDLSAVTDMSRMFQGATSFNNDISGWNVSSITDMLSLFNGASAFNQGLNTWNVSSVTDMTSMFQSASAFNGDIGSWDVGNVTSMRLMFRVATAFNQDIGTWNVGNVTDMSQMFDFALLFNQDIGSWDVSKVTTMYRTFGTAPDFNQNINNWNVGNVTNMQEMFSGANSFDQPLNSWDVSKVTNMREMFAGANVFNQNLNSWDVSSVTNMTSMFNGAYAFNGAIGNWNVGNVTNVTYMFRDAGAFNQDIGSWDVSSLTSLNYMFSFAAAFDLPLNNWNVSNVTSMRGVFNWATSFNQDLSSWDVSNVTDMRDMFGSANVFNQDISGWDVSQVTNFSGMFDFTDDFNQDISGWDVSSGQYLFQMFQYATAFNQDISGWNMSNAINVSSMFYGASAFNQSLAGWDIQNVQYINNLLDNSGMSTDSYDQTLISWSALSLQPDLTLGADGLFYCTGETARNTIIASFNWTIIDAGLKCPAGEIAVFEGSTSAGTEIIDGQATAFEFGYGGQGSDIAQQITIENQGDNDLVISDVAFTGTAFSAAPVMPVTIVAGDTETIGLQLSGATVGTFSETMTITSDDADEGVFDFPVMGVITASPEPEIVIYDGATVGDPIITDGQATAIGFGSGYQGTNITRQLTIENKGTATLNITSIVSSSSAFSSTTSTTSIAAGTALSIDVILDGATIGVYNATLAINNDDVDEAVFDFPLSGEIKAAPQPEIVVYEGAGGSGKEILSGQATAIDLGAADEGTGIQHQFSIANSGPGTLDISNITITGSAFTVLTATPLSVPTDYGAVTVGIELSGATPGAFAETVTIENNDADEDNFTFPITGEIVATPKPEIVVSEGAGASGSEIVNNQTTVVDIGAANEGTDIAYQFSITNSGTATLDVSSITIPGNAFNIITTLPVSTAAGTTHNIDISLSGAVAGTFAEKVTITSNDLDEGVFTFPITGTIDTTPVSHIDVVVNGQSQVNGESIIFKDAPVGAKEKQELEITNAGTVTLQITNIIIDGEDFELISAIPGPLAPGENTTLIIAFSPKSIGPKTAQLTIQSNSAADFVTTLSATGLSDLPEIEVVNVVTPLVNGLHDFLEIKNIEFYPENRLFVYSRWGDEVYDTERYNNDTNKFVGETSKGDELADGTYYYVLELNGGEEVKNGFFLLRR